MKDSLADPRAFSPPRPQARESPWERGCPNPEETGEILWITAPFCSKQGQRTSRPCSIAPIKDLYFFKVKKDTLLLSSLTLPTLKQMLVNDMTNISSPQE